MNVKYISTFKPVQNGLNAAVGDNGGKYDLFDYASSYLDASLTLAHKVAAEGVITDSVVYPICYSFRHGVELYIKYLIDDLGRLTGTWDEFKQGHSLLRNWKLAKRLLTEIEIADEDLKFFDNVVRDFERIDKNGMTFRYPDTIDRNPLIKDLKTINIAVIGNNCGGISEISKDWNRKIDGAIERAIEEGTLPKESMRPISKRPWGLYWKRFARLAKEAGHSLGARRKKGL